MLYSRYVKFLNSINKSSKHSVKYLLSVSSTDVRSVTGSNLRNILLTTGVQVTPGFTGAGTVRNKTLVSVPEGEEWKVPLLHSLLSVQMGEAVVDFEDDNELENDNVIEDILFNICTT